MFPTGSPGGAWTEKSSMPQPVKTPLIFTYLPDYKPYNVLDIN